MSQPKFCPKCGNALGENEKFCAKCGNPVPTAEAAPQTAPVAETVNETVSNATSTTTTATGGVSESTGTTFTSPVPPPVEVTPDAADKVKGGIDIAKYKKPIIIGAAALVVIIAAVAILMSLPKYQKIDAKDLFHISFKGVNSQGTVVGYLNCEEVCREVDYNRYMNILRAENEDYDYDDDDDDADVDDGYSKYFAEEKKELLKAYDTAKDKSEAADMKKALLKQSKKDGSYVLKLKFDKEEGLSNGDVVKCTVDFDEENLKEAKIKLENTEFEITVEGLLDGQKLDFFDGFNISFEGQNESGRATFDGTNSKLKFINYYAVSSNYNLTNGDSFEMEASINTGRVKDITYLDPEDYTKGMYFTYEDTIYIVDSRTANKSFTVSGLKELEEIDIFEGIKFNTTGGVPYLKIQSVNTEDCEQVIRNYVSFRIESDNDFLKAGDTFRVRASVGVSSLKSKGYKPNVELDDSGYAYKEFTVDESFGTYITNDSDPADVDKLEEEFLNFINKFENQTKNRTSINSIKFDGKIETFEYETYKNYVILPDGFAEGTINSYDPKNILFRVYKVNITARDDEGETSSKTIYLAFRFTGAYVDANGVGKLASGVSSYYAAEKPEDLQVFYDKDEKYGKAIEVGAPAPAPKPDESSEDESSSEESAADESGEDESAADDESSADESADESTEE